METPTISEKTISYFPPSLDNIPTELKGLPQWVAWKAAPNPKKGKPDKVPMNPKNGRGAGSTLPASWGRSRSHSVELIVSTAYLR